MKTVFWKKFICAVTVACMVMQAVLFGAPSVAANDPSGAKWYSSFADIAAGVKKETGTSGNLTRAMFSVILSRVSDADTSPCTALEFTDVGAGKWYSTSVEWVCEKGLCDAERGGEFRPSEVVTDEQIYTALCRYNLIYGSGTARLWRYSPYSDLSGLSDWAKTAIGYMNSTGASGDAGGSMFAGEEAGKSSFASRLAAFLQSYDPAPEPPQDTTVRATSLSLGKLSSTVRATEGETLNAVLLPENVTDPGIVWSSSDESVLTVSADGAVYGVSEGYATVTATSADGACAASCVYVVTPAPPPPPPPEVDNGRYIDPDKPMIAITYDDGPGQYTDRILDVLEQYGAVATFFEQGRNLSRWADSVNRALDMGCEVGSHTWNHPKLTTISDAEIRDQIKSTNDKFIEICGRAPTLIRPPYGSRNETVDAIVAEFGMSEILWNVDTEDWRTKNADKICEHIRTHAFDGAIILVHSIHEFTADATERFVPWLVSQGYQLVTVSEMAKARGVTLEPGHRYNGFVPK